MRRERDERSWRDEMFAFLEADRRVDEQCHRRRADERAEESCLERRKAVGITRGQCGCDHHGDRGEDTERTRGDETPGDRKRAGPPRPSKTRTSTASR